MKTILILTGILSIIILLFFVFEYIIFRMKQNYKKKPFEINYQEPDEVQRQPRTVREWMDEIDDIV